MRKELLEKANALNEEIVNQAAICDILRNCINYSDDYECRVCAYATLRNGEKCLSDFAILDKDFLMKLLCRAEDKLSKLESDFAKLK